MRVQAYVGALALTTAVLSPAAAQPVRQPEVVCDHTPILAGAFEGSRLSRHDLVRENAELVRLTFRDIDPAAGTAKMIGGQGVSGELPVSVSVDAGAIVYLHEKPGVSKMIVSTGTKPTVEGWPVVMSQHGWARGELTVRAASGTCRMRAR